MRHFWDGGLMKYRLIKAFIYHKKHQHVKYSSTCNISVNKNGRGGMRGQRRLHYTLLKKIAVTGKNPTRFPAVSFAFVC